MRLLLMSANLMFSFQPASNVEDPEVLPVQAFPLLGAQEGLMGLEDLAQPPEVAMKKEGLAVQVVMKKKVALAVPEVVMKKKVALAVPEVALASSQEAVLVVPEGQEGQAALFVPVDPEDLAILEVRGLPFPVGLGLEVRVPRKPFRKMILGKDMIAGNPAWFHTPRYN
jgi:hypothetical protein